MTAAVQDKRLVVPSGEVEPWNEPVGAQVPPIFHAPLWNTTAGDDAVDLAAAAGLKLLPWQQLVLRNALGERRGGGWEAFEVGLIVPRQNGKNVIVLARELAGLFLFDEEQIIHTAHKFKALDVSTPILTAEGWSTMGQLKDGMEVYGPDGETTRVTAHPIRYNRPCYRLTFDDGQQIVADEDHLWGVTYCRTPDSRPVYKVVSTKEIVEHGVQSVFPRRAGRDRTLRHFRVPVPKTLQFPEASLPVDPWILGFWLGDGETNGSRLSVGNRDAAYVRAQLTSRGVSFTETVEPRANQVTYFYLHGYRQRLRDAGVFGNKHIPELYQMASEPQRRELLRGLMDSDGARGRQGRIAYCSSRKVLCEDVLSLVRGLGEKAQMFDFETAISGKEYGTSYRVTWSATQATSPFGLERQTEALPLSTGRLSTRRSYNTIAKVEPVESRPTRCITVDNESKLYCVGRGFVPTHNTAKAAYRDLKKLIEAVPEFRDQVRSMPDSSDNTAIIMNDGRRCDFLARQSGGGRGFTGDTVILDEAFQVSDDLVSDLLPTLSAKPAPQVWYTSSTGFDYSITLKKVRKRAVEAPDDNKHLAYFEWAANVDEVDWRSVEAAQAANPSMGWYQSWDWIKEVEVDAMEEESYKRERLGVWADRSADAAIGVDLWARTRGTQELFEGNPPVRRSLSLDVSQDRDVCVIGGATELRDGTVVVDVIERRAGTAWVADTLRELVKRNRPFAGVVIDSLSGAAALHPHLMEAGIPVALAVTKDLTAGTADLYDRLARTDDNGDPDPSVFHGDNPFLDDAAHTARRRLVGASKSQWTWEQYGEVSVVPLRAITLALRGFQMQPLKRKRRGRVA